MFEEVKLGLYRGYWAATWRDPALPRGQQTKRQSLRTQDRAEALRRFENWKKENSEIIITDMPNVHDIVKGYLADKKNKRSYRRMCDAWRRLEPFFGWMSPEMLDNQKGRLHSREYVAQRIAQGIKSGTIRRELTVLRAALLWADKQSSAVIELPQAPPPRDRYLTREEVQRLLKEAERFPHLWLYIMIAYYTAARTGAIYELTWMQIDFVKNLIQFNTKDDHGNKKRALVPIAKPLIEVLRAAQLVATSPHVIEYAGHHIASSLKHSFKAAAVKAGFSVARDDPDKVTQHVLRHTAAVHMVENGVPLTAIAQYLGHTGPTTTYTHYARYSPEYLRDAVNALWIPKDKTPSLQIVPPTLPSEEQGEPE